jgi:hypothetical protein
MPYTASQLVTDACQIAQCPGYTAQGGRALNWVLEDLCYNRNLKVNLVNNTLTIPANSFGPFNLETNYNRTYDMFYTVSGTPYFLNPCSLKEIDSENYQSGTSNYPYEFATDLSGVPTVGYGLLYIYPASNSGLSVTHRYFITQPDIVSPETSSTIPWFKDQDYLVDAIAARLMRITNDDRLELFLKKLAKQLEAHLIMAADDEQQVVKEVQLDPRRFRTGGSNRPTKYDPY